MNSIIKQNPSNNGAKYKYSNSAGIRGFQALLLTLKPLGIFTLSVLAALTLSRIMLVFWQFDRVIEADMLASVFIQGIRFDLVLLGMTLVIPILIMPLLASNRFTFSIWRLFLRFYLPALLILIVFMECSTPSFMIQFDSRPNILFLEYLNHPIEVGSTLLATQKLPLTIATILCISLAWIFGRKIKTVTAKSQPLKILPMLLAIPLLAFLCMGAIRSTLDHRPVNPSTVALSNDPLVNDLALSSTYTALYAAYETRHEPDGGFRYAPIEDQEAVKQVREAMMIDDADFTSDTLPTMHRQHATVTSARPKNLVIILEESLGAEFVGSMGGLDLTPNLDKLATEGLWFENLFATGTRSVRGIEAVVTGFTPTPARSVVKLGKSQKNFYTLASLLTKSGYHTSFIYGGEAQFDNMRRFFMNNGFESVIDKNNFDHPVFTGSWGVSDEDLFNRAHEEFSKAGEKPFFSLVFTSTNHSPFEFPDDRITLYDAEKNTVNNAVKYADYALGKFFEAARQSDYWENTVFLIVADHNSRVYGSEIVPVRRFHVPALILGGSIKPAVYKPVASQIDLPPTLLSLIGISSTHPMIGHDLTRPAMHSYPGRAIMQFNSTQAYMEKDRVLILRKNLPAAQFIYQDHQLVPLTDTDPALIQRALAHSAWSSMAYEQKLYRLESE